MYNDFKNMLTSLDSKQRIFILIVCLFLVFWIVYVFAYRPLIRQRFLQRNQDKVVLKKRNEFSQQLNTLAQKSIQLQMDIKKLKDQENSQIKTKRLPTNMLNVLRHLFLKEYHLKLINLTSKPVESKQGGAQEKFSRVINIHFQGDYFSTLSYLREIESQHWAIYWNRLDYQVMQYPQADVQLSFWIPDETISSSKRKIDLKLRDRSSQWTLEQVKKQEIN